MARKRITIRLETEGIARVPVRCFQSALEDLTIILREVERELSEDKEAKLSWEIAELSLGSATIGLEPASEEYAQLAARTSRNVIRGLERLSRKPIRPDLFNNTALEKAGRLSRMVGRNGISRINLFSDAKEEQLYVTETIAVNAKALLEYIEFVSSVEGILELLSGREGERPYFGVRDVVSAAWVRCYFPEDMLEQALMAFRKRVVVSGIMQYDNIGRPRQIKVVDIEEVPTEESLPQAKDVRGTMKGQTGGLSSERYLREQFGD